ncbi:MAG TPA: tetratricopeptide repeat protein [Candidatus Eisenbacteria bacterium]|nr:tetratricopeptide repeat protein [Candidatus Eisenbacteria bacterium]
MTRGTASRPRAAKRTPRAARARRTAAEPLPPLPLSHPALWLVALAALTGVMLSVTTPLWDPDVWQHLLVGKVIWAQHAIPRVQMWSWPNWGLPEVNYAWGFETLLWPFYRLGGLLGLFAWRWVWTVAVFALGWATARRMGARGVLPLLFAVALSLFYRGRSMPRPENVAALLLAATLWVLESRRTGRARDLLLVPIALVWANTHLTWYFEFLLAGAYLLDAHLHPQSHAAPARSLWIACGLAALALLVNPFGLSAVWEPFDYFLHGRHELIYRSIGELNPVDWSVNWKNVLPVVCAGWPLLVIARLFRRRLDVVELLLCPFFVFGTLTSQRIMGPLAVAALPFVSRDVAEWTWHAPAALRSPWARAALAIAAMPLLGAMEWTRPEVPIAIRIDRWRYPIAACDFMAAEGIRGRMYNAFDHAGYIAWRFWPDRSRLPFMDIHQSGTPRDRDLYALASSQPDAWRALDEEHHFETIMLPRDPNVPSPLLDAVDADSTWALVFVDDMNALYVRRDGPLARVAERDRYRLLPAGTGSLDALGARVTADSTLRPALTAELRRAIAHSPEHAEAIALLANVAVLDGRWDEARARLNEALRVRPLLPRAHEHLGLIDLQRGHPADAMREFRTEWRLMGWSHGFDFRAGQVYEAQGDLHRAHDAYTRELRRTPAYQEARDSLQALEARGVR